jgi:putative N6-adenine-specific DNA methylase
MYSGTTARELDDLRLLGAFGTNKVMAGELSRLVRRAFDDVRLTEPRKADVGALIYPFDARVARLAALYHRTSARVLWDVIETRAPRLSPLFDDVVALAAPRITRWLWPDAHISVYAQNVKDFAAGERQIVGTVKNALIEAATRKGFEVSVDADKPDVVFSVRGDDSVLRVSVDLAGRPMNQRGYRRDRGLAPLREDLAAVLLMLARYDPRSDLLIDPMAGSGTIAIEAACMAKALPVFVPPRRPLVVDMPAFRDLAPAGGAGLFADANPIIVASDVNPGLAPVIREGAEAAGVGASIRVATTDFRDLSAREVRTLSGADMLERGLIISNPPYGERMRPDELRELYADLGRFCASFPGFRAAFIVANPDFEAAFGGRPRIKKPLSNGPLRGHFYLYEH